jgi:hypothetical protein
MKNINLVKKDEHNNKSDEFSSIKETIIITDNNKTKNINNNNPIILNKVSNILKMMNILEKKDIQDEEREQNEIKWKFAAIVLDRFFMILAALAYLIIFSTCILAEPNLYHATH